MNNYEKLHSLYERKAFKLIFKAFREINKSLPLDLLTVNNADLLVTKIVKNSGLKEAIFQSHLMIGNAHGKLWLKKFKEWEKGTKKRLPDTYPLFNKAWQKWLLAYFAENGGSEITLLSSTYVDEVKKVLVRATANFQTEKEIAEEIFKTVNSPKFYRYQAMRIARTETTFAVNAGTTISGNFTEIEINKEWIAFRDGKERPSHGEANGKKVTKTAYFNIGGEKLLYPGDRSGGASAFNLVNCRCRFGYVRGKFDYDDIELTDDDD